MERVSRLCVYDDTSCLILCFVPHFAACLTDACFHVAILKVTEMFGEREKLHFSV